MFRTLRYFVWLVLPFGIIHLWIVFFRNKLYDWHILKTKRLPKPVISIGNIQMGGTGKTPMTLALLADLQSKGISVGVLTRGYKRNSSEKITIIKADAKNNERSWESVGDEPAIILESMTNGALGVGADRWRVGTKILEENPVDLFLMDDGLQHRKLHRDLNICLIDMSCWRPHPFLFPFSYLRDCKSSLKRCHAVVLAKTGDRQDKARNLRKRIGDKYQIPIFEGELEPQALIRVGEEAEINPSKIHGQKVAAFCGIANPDYFFTTLKRIGMKLVIQKKYFDHHNYNRDDLHYLAGIIKEAGVEAIITTEKDAMKLKEFLDGDAFNGVEFYFLRVQFAMKEEKEFFELIQRSASPKSFN
jgi:tetraacyldisaccharide 4'-kinase